MTFFLIDVTVFCSVLPFPATLLGGRSRLALCRDDVKIGASN